MRRRRVPARIIGELVGMEGEFSSPVIRDGQFFVEATVPAANAFDFPVKLASMSGGHGVLTSAMCGYRACPPGFVQTTPRRGVDRSTARNIFYGRAMQSGSSATSYKG